MITKLTNINLINSNLQANSKKGIFEELAQMLLENNRISSKEDFLSDLENRESVCTTSTDGIAYPHAKSKAVIEPAIAIGVKREGIEYGDEDGIKASVFFMIASPFDGGDHHIYVLQDLFGKFSSEFIADIHHAKNENQILNILINS